MAVLESTLSAIKHYCAYQERCHSEVRSKLISLECYGEDLEEAISILISENYLNEERFAMAYAQGKFRMNKWGRIKIKLQLKNKKVSEYCINKGLQNIDVAEYWDTLSHLTERKMTDLKRTEKKPFMRYHKTVQYLLQKGFEQDLIHEALQALEIK